MRIVGMVVALGIAVAPAAAERKVQPGQPIVAHLELGAMTLIVLPEPIEGVFAYVDPKRYTLDYNGPMLALQPLVPDLRGRFVVIGSSGKDYTISYVLRDPADDKIHVLSEQQKPQIAAVMKPVGTADVMRALRLGQSIPGQAPIDMPAPVLQDPRIHLTGWQAVQVQTLVGLAVSIRNTTAQPVQLDIRYGMSTDGSPVDGVIRVSQWVLPPRYTVKGVSADREALAPGETVQVYFVLERR